jgi:hypothetical protein
MKKKKMSEAQEEKAEKNGKKGFPFGKKGKGK